MRLRPNSVFLPSTTSTWCPGGRRSGYTLVEILVALTLTLILMTAVVTVFGGVGDGIAKSRRAMEQFDRLRTTAQQLRLDLQGVTVKPDGHPVRPEESQGYLEIIEGSYIAPTPYNATSGSADMSATVGERCDFLMFTARNATRPFQGRYRLSADPNNLTLQSDVAEVAWFLRGKTLHRRVLLVVPGVAQNAGFASQQPSSYYAQNDISARLVGGKLVPNSLADLTKRENRFAHPVSTFPFDVRGWELLGLPTLAECSSPTWMAGWVNGTTPPVNAGPSISQMDYWSNSDIATKFNLPSGTTSPDQYLAQDGTRVADDVVLTNVIGFDVKVWEPALNTYVDLGYGGLGTATQLKNYAFPTGPTVARFQHPGVYALSQQYGLVATAQLRQCVYDTGCFSYENEGIYHFDSSGKLQVDVAGGTSTNGMADDPNSGLVDGIGECINSLPYPVPLRGIQITIRCYEPDSRQVRQITIEHNFLPK